MSRSRDHEFEGDRRPREAYVRTNARPNALSMDVYVNELRLMRRMGTTGPRMLSSSSSITRQYPREVEHSHVQAGGVFLDRQQVGNVSLDTNLEQDAPPSDGRPESAGSQGTGPPIASPPPIPQFHVVQDSPYNATSGHSSQGAGTNTRPDLPELSTTRPVADAYGGRLFRPFLNDELQSGLWTPWPFEPPNYPRVLGTGYIEPRNLHPGDPGIPTSIVNHLASLSRKGALLENILINHQRGIKEIRESEEVFAEDLRLKTALLDWATNFVNKYGGGEADEETEEQGSNESVDETNNRDLEATTTPESVEEVDEHLRAELLQALDQASNRVSDAPDSECGDEESTDEATNEGLDQADDEDLNAISDSEFDEEQAEDESPDQVNNKGLDQPNNKITDAATDFESVWEYEQSQSDYESSDKAGPGRDRSKSGSSTVSSSEKPIQNVIMEQDADREVPNLDRNGFIVPDLDGSDASGPFDTSSVSPEPGTGGSSAANNMPPGPVEAIIDQDTLLGEEPFSFFADAIAMDPRLQTGEERARIAAENLFIDLDESVVARVEHEPLGPVFAGGWAAQAASGNRMQNYSGVRGNPIPIRRGNLGAGSRAGRRARVVRGRQSGRGNERERGPGGVTWITVFRGGICRRQQRRPITEQDLTESSEDSESSDYSDSDEYSDEVTEDLIVITMDPNENNEIFEYLYESSEDSDESSEDSDDFNEYSEENSKDPASGSKVPEKNSNDPVPEKSDKDLGKSSNDPIPGTKAPKKQGRALKKQGKVVKEKGKAVRKKGKATEKSTNDPDPSSEDPEPLLGRMDPTWEELDISSDEEPTATQTGPFGIA